MEDGVFVEEFRVTREHAGVRMLGRGVSGMSSGVTTYARGVTTLRSRGATLTTRLSRVHGTRGGTGRTTRLGHLLGLVRGGSVSMRSLRTVVSERT